jgi:hypothetical protein
MDNDNIGESFAMTGLKYTEASMGVFEGDRLRSNPNDLAQAMIRKRLATKWVILNGVTSALGVYLGQVLVMYLVPVVPDRFCLVDPDTRRNLPFVASQNECIDEVTKMLTTPQAA